MRIVAFYHIDKAGGASVFEWFNVQRAELFHYGDARCFYWLPQHRDLFIKREDLARGPSVHCTELLRRVGNTSLVYLEYHAHVKYQFWDRLLPQAAELRRRHELFLTFTFVREPLSHLLSFYGMWPGRHELSLEQWLAGSVARGQQTRQLAVQHWGLAAEGCNTSLALTRLRSVDMACTLRWMHRCLARIAAVLARPFFVEDVPHVKPVGSQSYSSSVVVQRAGTVPYSLLYQAAECDQRLFDREQEWAYPRSDAPRGDEWLAVMPNSSAAAAWLLRSAPVRRPRPGTRESHSRTLRSVAPSLVPHT